MRFIADAVMKCSDIFLTFFFFGQIFWEEKNLKFVHLNFLFCINKNLSLHSYTLLGELH